VTSFEHGEHVERNEPLPGVDRMEPDGLVEVRGHGAALGALLGDRFEVLSGYRAPAARLAFGHVVVGTTGVFVVHELDGGGTIRARRGDVTFNGEPLGPLVQRVRRQGIALQLLLADALSELEVRVSPVLWARSARLGLRRAAVGVRLVTTRDLRRRIGRGTALLPATAVRRLVSLAETRMIPVQGSLSA
jgi:hypothetical protein